MKLHIHKVQCVIPDPSLEEALLTELHVLQHEKRGSLLTVVARGTRAEILMSIEHKHPIFSEVLPLTLEEIFISETEVVGYDIKNLVD
jgi:ABC-2 type transport system ATP-binding protein